MVYFAERNSFESRFQEAHKIREKYPEKVPIIIEKDKNSKLSDIDKVKYLVPKELTMGQLLFQIRKRVKLSPEKAMFIFCSNRLLPSQSLLSEIDENFRNEDGFIYMKYTDENAFGKNSF
jgi:GABA(A) receptor-associated protein